MPKQSTHQPAAISDIRALSKLNALRSLMALAGEWLLIAAAIALHARFPHPAVYVISWLIIGTRMYALYSLLHDGMHCLLFPNRAVNDWLCRLFLAGPLFLSLRKVRKFHLSHHQHLKTPADPEAVHLQYPEFQFPKTEGSLLFTFLKDITGVNFIFYKTSALLKALSHLLKKKSAPAESRTTAAEPMELFPFFYYPALILFLLYMQWEIPFLLYWVIPYITVYQALNRLRLSTEHFHLPPDKIYQTRTVQLNVAEQFIFSPHNLGYHTEHHLYPSVPFYRLPALHRLLMQQEEFQQNVLVSKSYLAVIKEYVKQP